jgi:uncharacterized protein DUF4953/uncharacterized protein DUF5117
MRARLPLLALAALVSPAAAQAPAAAKEPEFPPFEKAVEGLTKVVSLSDGPAPLYELWADKKTARLVATLPADFATQELMVACTVTSGHPEAGVMGPTYYGSWRRMGKQLAFVVPDLSVRSEGASKAAVANLYTDRLLVTTPILALVDGARPVIDLGALATQQAPKFFGESSGYGPALTSLQAPLATITKAKAFPKNVVLEFEAPQGDGRLMRIAYSIGTLAGTPGYEPRAADGRVGFFYDWYTDTVPGEFDREPERFINRWNVTKADPKLSKSPPAQPIVWYVEHTTPIKYRRWVREGIELWNEAYAKIGILGALEVYQQDATTGAHMDKDPEDARYNFFRWNMSDAAYAIGPSRSNPRTGEILEADVVWNQGLTRAVASMLGTLSKGLVEASGDPELLAWYAANPRWDPRVRLGELSALPAPATPVVPAANDPRAALGFTPAACHMGQQLAVDLSLAGAAFEAGLVELESADALDGVPEEFLGPMIRYISAHEVGHCLGLQHNMAASSLVPLEQMNAAGYDGIVTASVMDYVAPNIAEPGTKQQGPFINAHLGPYDVWAIACGYGPKDALAAELAKSSQPEHTYVSQAAISFGSDPRNQTWDVGADNLDFCEARMRLVQALRTKITDELVKDGESWAEARRRYQQLLGTQLRTLFVAAAWIGGSYENQDVKGTPGAKLPVEDVAAADQRRALAFVMQTTFEDAAFGLTPELVRHFGKQYWFDPAGIEELTQDSSYDVHDLVGGIQATGLSLLLSPTRLRRVHDNEFRSAGQTDAFTLAELLTRVTDCVWKECANPGAVSASAAQPLCSSFRRNLQWEHTSRLVDLVLMPDTTSPALRAITTLAASELRRVDALAKETEARPLDPATKAHLAELRTRIEKALDAAYVKRG